MSRLRTMGLAMLALGGALTVVALAEDVTVSTYYPSPKGIYQQLSTTGQTTLATLGGNVGIGTAGPAAKLEVNGPATGTGVTIHASGGGDLLLNPGGSLFFDGNYNYATGSYIRPVAANTQTFVTSGAERMRITNTGNVGIGVAAPGAKLDVNGSLNAGATTLGATTVNSFRMATGAPAAGKALTADAAGNATWQNPVAVYE